MPAVTLPSQSSGFNIEARTLFRVYGSVRAETVASPRCWWVLTFNWVAGLPPSRLPVVADVQLVITSPPMFPPSLITPISISVLSPLTSSQRRLGMISRSLLTQRRGETSIHFTALASHLSSLPPLTRSSQEVEVQTNGCETVANINSGRETQVHSLAQSFSIAFIYLCAQADAGSSLVAECEQLHARGLGQ